MNQSLSRDENHWFAAADQFAHSGFYHFNLVSTGWAIVYFLKFSQCAFTSQFLAVSQPCSSFLAFITVCVNF